MDRGIRCTVARISRTIRHLAGSVDPEVCPVLLSNSWIFFDAFLAPNFWTQTPGRRGHLSRGLSSSTRLQPCCTSLHVSLSSDRHVVFSRSISTPKKPSRNSGVVACGTTHDLHTQKFLNPDARLARPHLAGIPSSTCLQPCCATLTASLPGVRRVFLMRYIPRTQKPGRRGPTRCSRHLDVIMERQFAALRTTFLCAQIYEPRRPAGEATSRWTTFTDSDAALLHYPQRI
ncbi:hypothetical protein BDZ89DRAFT_72267 [Hymenopellis radicata]|nr:hypothetical protein BDZ89DRAFT_72267 [Hymenopellis radicata]